MMTIGQRTRAAELPCASGSIEAVEKTIVEGACFMKRVIDPDFLSNTFRDVGLEGVDIERGAYLPDDAEIVPRVMESQGILKGILAALRERDVILPNSISMAEFELGQSLLPHVDNVFITEGVSILMPLGHRGRIGTYKDSHYDISPWSKVSGKFTRHAERNNKPGIALEYEGVYERGDVLLLRQDIPSLGKRAKVHSASSESKKSNGSLPTRQVVVFDHIVSTEAI
jgi:hypothetical protein